MTLFVIIAGFAFGLIMIIAGLNKNETITQAALLKDFTVPKALLAAIGLGMMLLIPLINLGLAGYHIKPFITTGLILGGLLFGTGMAILGYCPGTLTISMGEGSLDAFWGVLGGLSGGVVFTLIFPFVSGWLGPNLGKISLQSLFGSPGIVFYGIVFLSGLLFIYLSFVLNKKENATNYKWLISGILLALLNVLVFLKSGANRPIGASTTYPFLGDWLTGLTGTEYFQKIKTPGNWEFWFLTGSFLAGLVSKLLNKDFKFRTVYPTWEKYHGSSALKRAGWAFAGGFILLLGARMAGGCTSGHILSGGMQWAISSYVFALFVTVAFVATGKLFYKSR